MNPVHDEVLPIDSLVTITNDVIKSHLHRNSIVCFRVTTGSMSPGLKIGDQILVHKSDSRELEIGDIVLLEVASVRRVHRLIAKRTSGVATYLTTRGDSSGCADEEQDASRLVGIVVGCRRGGRTINMSSRRALVCNRLAGFLSRLAWETRRLPCERLGLLASRLLLVVARQTAQVISLLA